jgi:hypothetical protein
MEGGFSRVTVGVGLCGVVESDGEHGDVVATLVAEQAGEGLARRWLPLTYRVSSSAAAR